MDPITSVIAAGFLAYGTMHVAVFLGRKAETFRPIKTPRVIIHEARATSPASR